MLEMLYGTMDIFGEAYSIRLNGKGLGLASADGIKIVAKSNNEGINVRVEPGLKHGMIHVPTLLSKSGAKDKVCNDFHIGAGSQVVIMAGCGIHSDTTHLTQHDGVHRFFVGAGAKVRYVEKHFGMGEEEGRRTLNPTTIVRLEAGGLLEMEMMQIGGIDVARRTMKCEVGDGARLLVSERVMTGGHDKVVANYAVNLVGGSSGATLSSRVVAKDKSRQKLHVELIGESTCFGHSQCDAMIMDDAIVEAIPEVKARHADAKLVHEAAIGRIAEDQIIKLMTLGLSEKEAERTIVDGFLGQ